MNARSREKTLPGEREVRFVRLLNYQRKLNAPVDGYLYLNIVKAPGKSVPGVLIPVTSSELGGLTAREPGYERVDVTKQLDEEVNGEVYAYMAPDLAYPDMKIPRSYIQTCIRDFSDVDAQTWISETIIANEIEEDMENPVYEFHA